MEKYTYVEGFCKKSSYKGLWACSYVLENGRYKKNRMVCAISNETCRENCTVFGMAPDVLPKKEEFMLKEMNEGTR